MPERPRGRASCRHRSQFYRWIGGRARRPLDDVTRRRAGHVASRERAGRASTPADTHPLAW